PAGFETVAADAAASGRAPLRAYYRPPAVGKPTVVVVHGLYDSKHSRYVRVTAERLAADGFGVLAPDMRWHGCLLTDFLPTLGVEEGLDLAAWSGWLSARQPRSPVGLVGYSLGSLAVVHALAADGGSFRAGGVAVSLPAALARTLAGLDDRPSLVRHGREALIRGFFRWALRVRMRALGVEEGPERRPFAALLAWVVRQPPFPPGTTPERAIERAGPLPQLAAVRRPLLLVIGLRDPVLSPAGVPKLAAAAAANPFLHLVATTDGGHIGHPGTYPRWTAEVYHRFFAASAGVDRASGYSVYR
ncbi:MAG TPA: alpha/beta fold hydrolase, partial [Thermoanaerobaculia bacterium]|nr:alpha/beta fold hydrolase [Thermoanaerobaculia bacterium]